MNAYSEEIAKRVNKILIFTTSGDYRTVDRQNNMLSTSVEKVVPT